MTLLDFLIRILSAVAFGFLIGLERQLTGHMAGIRINILVSLGTSLFVLFSVLMEAPDTTRIAAQIVTGVGFLCSGIIFKDGVQVRGLNTAATIWCTAAIGVLGSSGKVLYAFLATALLLVVNLAFRPVAQKIHPLGFFSDDECCYKITVTCDPAREMLVRSLLLGQIAPSKLTLSELDSRRESGRVTITATLLCGRPRNQQAESLIRHLMAEDGVTGAGWEFA